MLIEYIKALVIDTKNKVKNYFAKLDENAVVIAFAAITATVSYFASILGIEAIQILSIKMMNLSLVTLFTSIYLRFLYTAEYDIRKEILEENNLAAAVYAGIIYLGNCLVVTLNS